MLTMSNYTRGDAERIIFLLKSVFGINVSQARALNSTFRSAFLLIGLLSLTGCASTGELDTKTAANDTALEQVQDSSLSQNDDGDTDRSASDEQISEAEIDPLLPKLDLDALTLEQLLVYNLASYQGDWGRASSNALAAAISSQDYRLARVATLLALRNSDYNNAVKGAELWADLKPDSLDATNMRLLSQIGAGQFDASLVSLNEHAQEKTLDSHVRQVAGLITRQRNSETALQIAEHYVAQHPESAQVMLSMSFVAESFAQADTAEMWLERALELRPNWELAAQMKANMLGRMGKAEERSAFIQEFIVANPSTVTMRINHAVELARAEEYQPALEVMQAVIVDAPKNVGALSYAAALAQELEQPELAKEYYQTALKAEPANDEVRWSLGRLAAIEENYASAEKYFGEIADPQSYIAAQIQVANMRYHTKGIKKAINTLRALEPETEAQYIEVALTRHYLLMQDHQYEEAFGSMNETLVYLPDNTTLLYARALVAAELKKIDIAEADFKSVLSSEPNHANALNAYGYTLADQTERYDEALALISRAIELRPEDAHILDSMGWILYRMDQKAEAIEFLEKAFAASPEIEIAAHLGEVFWESGETERARQVWQESFDTDQSNPVLNETLERYGIDFTS